VAATRQLREELRISRRRAKTSARLPRKATRDRQQALKAACQGLKHQEEEWIDIEEAPIMTTRGRIVHKPSRFRR
jgi:hypothetical protein